MITLEEVRLDNFMLYGTTSLPLASDDPSRPVTAIRGYNEHGKTSLFRALEWVVFGESVIEPEDVRPFGSTDDIVTSTGELRFSVLDDGMRTQYRIRRQITTTADGQVDIDAPVLFRRSGDDWTPDPRWDVIQSIYFPAHLHTLLFMDKDRPSEFAGPDRQDAATEREASEAVTHAIDQLLGLDILAKAIRHLRRVRTDLDAQVSADDPEELDAAREARDTADQAVTDAEDEIARLSDELERLRATLAEQERRESELTAAEGAMADVTDRLEANTEALQAAKSARDEWQRQIAETVTTPANWACGFHRPVAQVLSVLNDQYDRGVIPQSQLPLLKGLLDPDVNPYLKCICGETDLHGAPRRRIEALIRRSEASGEDADLLARFRTELMSTTERAVDATDGFVSDFAQTQQQYKARLVDVAGLDEKRLDLLEERRALTETNDLEALRAIAHQIGATRERIRRLEADRTNLTSKLTGAPNSLGRSPTTTLQKAKQSAERRYSSLVARDAERRPLLYARQAAEAVIAVIDRSSRRIRAEQVPAVADAMNALFGFMTDNFAGTEDGVDPYGKTQSVGIRPEGGSHRFELHATDDRGRDKPLRTLNGASRRALGIAFVLALFETSGTSVPLVFDSLLHTLAGGHKVRTLQTLAERMDQCILTYTHDDVGPADARQALADTAGLTYTLSNQTRPELVERVPARTATRSMITVCACGPASRCRVCTVANDSQMDTLTEQAVQVVN